MADLHALPDDAHPEPEDHWRVATGRYPRCHGGQRRNCGRTPVAELLRGTRRPSWWAYCTTCLADYNRAVRDGQVWWLGTINGENYVHATAGGAR